MPLCYLYCESSIGLTLSVVIGRLRLFGPDSNVLGQTWDSDNYYFHSKDNYFIIDDYNDFVCTTMLVSF